MKIPAGCNRFLVFSKGSPGLATASPGRPWHLNSLPRSDDRMGGVHSRSHLIQVDVHRIHGRREVLDDVANQQPGGALT